MTALIAIPVKNRLDLTKPLVEALIAGGGGHLTVYDNGSTDGTYEWMLAEGIGHSPAAGMTLHEMWNHAIDVALEWDLHLVLLNNDLKLDGKPDWVNRLCDPLAQGWDAVCPNYDGRRSWRPVQPLTDICANRYDGTGGLSGFAFALSKTFLRAGYRFPTEAKWWYGDTDLVMTLDKEGRPYGMVIDCGVTHIGGGSQTAKDYDLSEQTKADQAWFRAKWGAPCTTP